MRTVTLEVSSREETNRRVLRAFEGLPQGDVISFETPTLLFKVLTQKRWELIAALTGAGPVTLREAARRVERDVEAVHEDVLALINAGVLRNAGADRIELPFDAVHGGRRGAWNEHEEEVSRFPANWQFNFQSAVRGGIYPPGSLGRIPLPSPRSWNACAEPPTVPTVIASARHGTTQAGWPSRWHHRGPRNKADPREAKDYLARGAEGTAGIAFDETTK